MNQPAELAKALAALERVQKEFNASAPGGKKVSLADLIVLGGCAGVEDAARKAGTEVRVPFHPGRTDATAEQTDATSFAVLEPAHDGFRNYLKGTPNRTPGRAAGGPRVHAQPLGPRDDRVARRVCGCWAPTTMGLGPRGTHEPAPARSRTTSSSTCSTWAPSGRSPPTAEGVFEGKDRKTGAVKWSGSRVDLVFGSNSQLRAVAELYAASDAQEKFARDFAAAWAKVMENDRFDLDPAARDGARLAGNR